jgi:hypothetical protein
VPNSFRSCRILLRRAEFFYFVPNSLTARRILLGAPAFFCAVPNSFSSSRILWDGEYSPPANGYTGLRSWRNTEKDKTDFPPCPSSECTHSRVSSSEVTASRVVNNLAGMQDVTVDLIHLLRVRYVSAAKLVASRSGIVGSGTTDCRFASNRVSAPS